jgi:hypothetical protein
MRWLLNPLALKIALLFFCVVCVGYLLRDKGH